jgi:Flp pilus assembly pilin Flp
MVERLNFGILQVALAAQAGLANRLRRQEGQAFVEYALILTLVAVAIALLTQWGAFTTAISNSLQKVIDALSNAGT